MARSQLGFDLPSSWAAAADDNELKVTFNTRVRNRLEQLLGTDILRLNDRQYMRTLMTRIYQDQEHSLQDRAETRQMQENKRLKGLVEDMKMEKPPDMLESAFVVSFQKTKAKLTKVQRRQFNIRHNIKHRKTVSCSELDDEDESCLDVLDLTSNEQTQSSFAGSTRDLSPEEDDSLEEEEREIQMAELAKKFGKYEEPLVRLLRDEGTVPKLYDLAEIILVKPPKPGKKRAPGDKPSTEVEYDSKVTENSSQTSQGHEDEEDDTEEDGEVEKEETTEEEDAQSSSSVEAAAAEGGKAAESGEAEESGAATEGRAPAEDSAVAEGDDAAVGGGEAVKDEVLRGAETSAESVAELDASTVEGGSHQEVSAPTVDGNSTEQEGGLAVTEDDVAAEDVPTAKDDIAPDDGSGVEDDSEIADDAASVSEGFVTADGGKATTDDERSAAEDGGEIEETEKTAEDTPETLVEESGSRTTAEIATEQEVESTE